MNRVSAEHKGGGLGVYFDEYGIAQPPDEPCPAGCDKGRRREGK